MKFNFVGAVGIGVQLAMLAVLTRVFHVEYMIATALAVETTVLHNFLWHERYTWIDRRAHSHFWRRLMHFNLSNGAISILGNVALMRLLVGSLHLPILISNGIAIAACGLANFLVSDRIVFRHRPAKTQLSVMPRGE
ncbi:MAG TPA: GtrA family protein, partial [Terriglobales bacterium]|nr:GtrA family protein [Terriglobales bacterium]